jgi:hypothetical protein
MTAGATYRCAMCGESAGVDAPYGGFKIPPRCVDLMQNSDGVDTDAIATVKAARDGRDEYLLDSDVLEAKVVVLSMRELGAIA